MEQIRIRLGYVPTGIEEKKMGVTVFGDFHTNNGSTVALVLKI